MIIRDSFCKKGFDKTPGNIRDTMIRRRNDLNKKNLKIENDPKSKINALKKIKKN